MSSAHSSTSHSSLASSTAGASQSGLTLARLNSLLDAFGIDLHIPRLSLTPPSLLLAILEAILGGRLSSPSVAVRSSRDSQHRRAVCDAFLLTIHELAALRGLAWVEVDSARLEAGRRKEVGLVVELLWAMADKAVAANSSLRTPDEHDSRTEEGKQSSTAALLWPEQTTPTPAMSRTPANQPPDRPKSFSPPRAPSLSHSTLSAFTDIRSQSTRPSSSMSNESSASRSLLRALSTTSPPPLTPTKRSTLSLLSRADATAPPPLLMLPPELRTAPFYPAQHAIRRPIPRRPAPVERVSPPASGSYLNGTRQGKEQPPARDECSCDGHDEQPAHITAHSTAPEQNQGVFGSPVLERGSKGKQKRRPRQPLEHSPEPSSSSSAPPSPRAQPKAKAAKSRIALLDPKHQPRRAQSQPQSQHAARSKPPPARSSTATVQVRPAARKGQAGTGYHSVVGESEIKAFESSKRRAAKLKAVSRTQLDGFSIEEGAEAGFDLDQSEGWSWLRAPAGAEPEAKEGDDYTRMLLEEKARLLAQLRDLKLQQLAIERAAPACADEFDRPGEVSGMGLDELARELSSRCQPG